MNRSVKLRSRWLIGLSFLICGIATSFAAAPKNPGARQVHEMLLLDVDNAATKKFTTVQTHLRVGQLREAIELLQSIGDAHVGKLVAAGQGRYVNVRNYAQMLAAGLSPEGLRIYRESLDPVLKPTFETARLAGDEVQLEKIVRQGYCCSFADDALLMLGDLAWDAGDIWRARSYWEQLLPPPPAKPGEPIGWLAYPDSDLDPALVLGRLVLCSIQAGQQGDIQKELAEFARRHPQAEGRLAGKTGNLLEILQGAAKEAEQWRDPVHTSLVETFAGSPQRFHAESSFGEVGRLRWKVPLKAFGEEPRRGFQQGSLGGLSYFPVVYGDVVLVNDDEHIHAYSLQTGKPAWSDDPSDARIYFSGIDRHDGGNPPRGVGEPLQSNIGLPRFSMTIANGRLFARMGSVQPYSGDRGGLLVCLDLAQGEGKLVWETFASAVEPETGGWIFEGSPLVVAGRAYVGMRRLNPQPQANVACFDALTGKLIWNRKLCVGQTNPNFPDFDVNQHLLTWGEGTLYYTTHMGAVAAIDPRQGTIKWIVSYPRVEDTKFRHELASRLRRGPLPAMFANGMLYTAPIDSDELLAFDAETGLLKWRRSFSSSVQAVLGVSQGMVYASGAELWALSADSGQIVWKVGDPDPESHGFGRGLLVDNLIYWPTHEEIFIVEQQTGALRQRAPLFAVHGQYAGNLILADHHLLIAQPNALAVFSDRGPPPDRSKTQKPEFTRRETPARLHWEQARYAAGEQSWAVAADQFHQARELADANDEWMNRPLSKVTLECEIDARLRHAWQLTKSDATAANQALIQAFEVAAHGSGTRSARDATLQRAAFGHDDHRDNHWRLRLPNSIPDDMRTWLGQQLVAQMNSAAATNDGLASPFIEEVSETEKFQTRSVVWRNVTAAETPVAVAPRVVTDETQPKPLPDQGQFPCPLTRRWEQSFGKDASLVYPFGTPASLDQACALVDRSPVACLNLVDGAIRWEAILSHPLRWASYYEESLILATEIEVRAVSVRTGELLWQQRLGSEGEIARRPLREMLTLVKVSPGSRPGRTANQGDRLPSGRLAEFVLTGETVLARQMSGRLLAWNAVDGRLIWQFEAARGLFAGWGVTQKHLLVSQKSPASLVLLNPVSGTERFRYEAASADWVRSPFVREDGTILTVGQAGRIESWFAPGTAWEADQAPRAWTWHGAFSQSLMPADVLAYGRISLLVLDGQTLIAVDSIQGNMLWKTALGTSAFDDARNAICCDEDHVYVAADGLLRAYSLQGGDLYWERYLGSPDVAWKSSVRGSTVMAYPAHSKRAASAVAKSPSTGSVDGVILCDSATGRYLQRLSVPANGDRVQFYPTTHTTLLACGGTICGLGR